MMNSEITRIVSGAHKFARRDDCRETRGRQGKKLRQVSLREESLISTSDGDCTLTDSVEEVAETERRRKIVQGQLQEFTTDPKRRELAERALLSGEPTAVLAEELGLTDVNARSILHRARRYLGIDGQYRPLDLAPDDELAVRT